MILFALGFLLVIIYIFKQQHFVFALVLFFALFDMFDGFYKDNQIFAAIRYAIPFTLILAYIFTHNAFKKSDSIFLYLILYLIILLIFNHGDLLLSTKTTLALVIALLMIPVGRHFSENRDFIEEFEKYNRLLLFIIPLYIIYANLFKIGDSYTDSFTTGFLTTSRMYIAPILIFLGVHYIISNKSKGLVIKTFDIGLILINICILIVITRRTSLGMIVGALLIYTLLNRRLIFKMLILIFCFAAALVFSYPLYEEKLNAQLEKRERIQDLDTYEEEGRYLETLYIMKYHENSKVSELLFGVTFFDTLKFGIKYFGRDRPIHSDINMIFFSTGLVGCLLFLLFFTHYFVIGNSKITWENKKVFYPLLVMFLIILIPGRFIGTFTFAPLIILLLTASKYKKPITDQADQIEELNNTFNSANYTPYPPLISN
jgi:hypothetical protein